MVNEQKDSGLLLCDVKTKNIYMYKLSGLLFTGYRLGLVWFGLERQLYPNLRRSN